MCSQKEDENMSTLKNVGKVFVFFLAIIGLLFLPKMVLKGTVIHETTKALEEEEARSNNFEDHLWNAKKLVAKELNYEGALDRLELYTAGGCYSYKLLTDDGYESGSFSDKNAKAELDKAVSYGDNHAGFVDAAVAGANGLESGVILGIIAAALVAAVIVGIAYFCVNWLEDFDATELLRRKT